MLARRILLRSKMVRMNTTVSPPPGPPPPPPPPPEGGSNSTLILAVLLGMSGATYYFQDNLKGWFVDSPKPVIEVKQGITPPTQIVVKDILPSKAELDEFQEKLVTRPAIVAMNAKKETDWKLVRTRVVELLDDLDYDDGSYGPLFVRLAWHAAGRLCIERFFSSYQMILDTNFYACVKQAPSTTKLVAEDLTVP